MRWVEWGTEQRQRLADSSFMLMAFNLLLNAQRKGGIKIATEGYLLGEPFGRGITMSAYVEDERGGVLGAKWVTSQPRNLNVGLPRGQAITVLNDGNTGLPVLAFDGTDLSNARTAIFNIAATMMLGPPPKGFGFVGAGRVHVWMARYIRQVWPDVPIFVYDTNTARAIQFATDWEGRVVTHPEAALAMDVVSVATAGAPNGWITPSMVNARIFFNTSLRDIQPGMFWGGWKGATERARIVVDDHDLAAQPGTPYGDAVTAWHVLIGTNLCDVPPAWKEKRIRTLVNPMGCAAWDVGLGYAIWQEEFEAGRPQIAEPEQITSRR